MLVLTRTLQEAIVIGEPPNQITVRLIQIEGANKIRLGIIAPKCINIVRSELLPGGAKERRKDKEAS